MPEHSKQVLVVDSIKRLLEVQESNHGRWGMMLHVVHHVIEALNVRLNVAASNEALLIFMNDVPNMPLKPMGQNTRQNLHVHIQEADGAIVLGLRLGTLLVQQYQCADKLQG